MTDTTATPAVPEAEAAASLPVEKIEDAALVAVVRDVGPPPPLLQSESSARKGFAQEHKDWVARFLTRMPSPSLAADLLGVSSDTIHYHRRTDPAFRAAYDQAMEDAKQTLLGAAAEEVLGVGFAHVLTRDGDVITVPKERNDKLLLAYVNGILGQKHVHEGLDGEPPAGSFVLVITPRQLARLDAQDQEALTLLLAKLDSLAPQTIDQTPEALAHDGA